MVVVVEDDRVTRMALSQLVRSAGLQVFAADCVARGMSSLSFNPVSMLLDLTLPDGSGADILKHIRRHALPTKVAVVTGTTDQSVLHALNELKPDLVVKKPMDTKLILAWLRANEPAKPQ